MNKMTELVNMKLLDTLESTLLFELCDSRIQYIFYGSSNRKTRMMPSLGIQEKDKSMAMFEFKMDTLLNMEKRGNMDAEELNLAMDNILQEVKKASLLGIIDYHKLLYCFPARNFDKNESEPNDTLHLVDKTIHDFNTSYKEFMRKFDDSKADEMQKEMYESYKSVKKELEAYTSIYPQFCELIKDLVMNA
jgi:hypothetical protein